jgi:hypothetical protein
MMDADYVVVKKQNMVMKLLYIDVLSLPLSIQGRTVQVTGQYEDGAK